MAKAYSYDLRQKVINAIQLDGMKQSEAAQVFQLSRNTINLWLKRQKETGDYQAKTTRPHRTSSKITDWDKFAKFVKQHGGKTQAQMVELWQDQLSVRTISRALHKLGLSRKKTYGYLERDEHKRAEFLEQLAKVSLSDRVYIDESGMDEREDYGYGWCEPGVRFEALKSGRRGQRINMIAAYCELELSAPFTVNGSCNRVVFEIWLETCLLPTLKPGKVLILDNATFHHGGRVAQLVESAGCRLLYLPAYSPDFNRIEKCWAWLKSRIRNSLSSFSSLRQAMESVLRDAVS
ncbi:IS630 family transposase [Leptolyngbya sp. Cla-17]|uniref:IS630 family transposase n=1 Tax=Leptolyngbya sp. Cla-17 TaxID=2803751 RepID=UPI001F5DB3FA|nr:IS630 family transposase [Leptolyngbya sp. Cla-17]